MVVFQLFVGCDCQTDLKYSKSHDNLRCAHHFIPGADKLYQGLQLPAMLLWIVQQLCGYQGYLLLHLFPLLLFLLIHLH